MASEHRVLAQLLSAGSLHRLQDRAGRDAVLDGLHLHKGSATVRAAAEGGRLLAAEWALDDQDATRAQSLLDALPPGVARRSHALRLRLRAARLGRKTQDALEITRLLAKHQAFSPTAARGLLRALALEHLDAARDASQLRRQWDLLDTSDRADSVVLAQAVRQAATLGAQEDARRWIEPAWAGLHRLDAAERAGLALALAGVAAGAEPVWLERMEQAVRDWPADPNIAAAAGEVYAARQLWGKARRALESAAAAPALVGTARRRAWRSLALLAREEDDEARAARCDRAAAEIDD
jgi:HemY protein